MNALKCALFRWYARYEARFPHNKGNYQLAQFLYKIFGLAAFTIDSFKIELNPIAAIDRALILGIKHDEIVSNYIEQMTGGSFLDVGANIGYFSIQAASKGYTVYAFEPSPRELLRFKQI